jgi:hypothetical protein
VVDRTRRIKVCLGQQLIHVGDLLSILSNGRESLTFRYAQTWLDAKNSFALAPHHARDKAKRMAEIISAGWKIEAQNAGMSDQQIKDYTPAFEHREMTRALSITAA